MNLSLSGGVTCICFSDVAACILFIDDILLYSPALLTRTIVNPNVGRRVLNNNGNTDTTKVQGEE